MASSVIGFMICPHLQTRVCLTLARVCRTLARVCLTLTRVCLSPLVQSVDGIIRDLVHELSPPANATSGQRERERARQSEREREREGVREGDGARERGREGGGEGEMASSVIGLMIWPHVQRVGHEVRS